jgi:hypothetical protein
VNAEPAPGPPAMYASVPESEIPSKANGLLL